MRIGAIICNTTNELLLMAQTEGGWNMLEQIESIKREELNSNVEESSGHIDVEEEGNSTSLNIDKLNEQGLNESKRGTLFLVQLLICSLLLWSLLFIKESIYGTEYMSNLTKILTQNIEIEPVQRVVNQLTVAIKQIL